MIDRKFASALAVVAMFAGSACPVVTDVNKPCVLVKKDPSDPEGKRSIPIKESEIQANKDLISFGAVECENLVCVRDLNYKRPADATDDTAAVGYCSSACVQTSTTACVSSDSAQENDPETKLSCRALLLDEATLAAICQDPNSSACSIIGNTKSPFFCARGGVSTDGGTQ